MITWDKPNKVMSKEQHQSISADGAPPGVYQPNMSKEDQLKVSIAPVYPPAAK